MTFREKLAKEHPNKVGMGWVGGCCGCPSEYGYEKSDRSCCDDANEDKCRKCWEREMPKTYPYDSEVDKFADYLIEWIVFKDDMEFDRQTEFNIVRMIVECVELYKKEGAT